MDTQLGTPRHQDRAPARDQAHWERPSVEVICLACEISAYAPDQDGPLF